MKWIYRLFTISMLSAVIIGPFFFKTENGKPIVSMPTVDDFIPDKIIPDSLMPGGNNTNKNASRATTSNEQTYFKWKDEKGAWHYGDQPPPGSQNVSTLQVDTNVNIIQSVKIEPKTKAQPLQQKKEAIVPERLKNGGLSLENAMNVMDDARAVSDIMNARNEQLKAMTGE